MRVSKLEEEIFVVDIVAVARYIELYFNFNCNTWRDPSVPM